MPAVLLTINSRHLQEREILEQMVQFYPDFGKSTLMFYDQIGMGCNFYKKGVKLLVEMALNDGVRLQLDVHQPKHLQRKVVKA